MNLVDRWRLWRMERRLVTLLEADERQRDISGRTTTVTAQAMVDYGRQIKLLRFEIEALKDKEWVLRK